MLEELGEICELDRANLKSDDVNLLAFRQKVMPSNTSRQILSIISREKMTIHTSRSIQDTRKIDFDL